MSTITKVAKDAKFFSSMSNARRALKKVLDVDTATANSFIHVEALEDGGRYWFSEGAVNKAAAPQVEADKVTKVTISNATVTDVITEVNEVNVDKKNHFESTKIENGASETAPKSKSRSVVQNGVRQPIKGKCAEVWATLTAVQEISETDAPITITEVKALAESHGWNINNATIEFYAWRKFHGYAK